MHSTDSLSQELDDRRRHFGINHISVAETLNTIGVMHHHITGDQDKAITHHQEALNILISQQYKTQEMLVDIATTIYDIGNCHWKKGELVLANEMWHKALKYLDRCFSRQSHPKKRMFQQSIQNRMEHINDPCTQSIKKVSINPSESPLDCDINLLARLSYDDLFSSENDFPNVKKLSSSSLSAYTVFQTENRVQIRQKYEFKFVC